MKRTRKPAKIARPAGDHKLCTIIKRPYTYKGNTNIRWVVTEPINAKGKRPTRALITSAMRKPTLRRSTGIGIPGFTSPIGTRSLSGRRARRGSGNASSATRAAIGRPQA